MSSLEKLKYVYFKVGGKQIGSIISKCCSAFHSCNQPQLLIITALLSKFKWIVFYKIPEIIYVPRSRSNECFK